MKIFIFLISILPSFNAFSAGPYDGIWHSFALGYFSVHERNGEIIAARLDPTTQTWRAYQGTRNNNIVNFQALSNEFISEITVTFKSELTFTAIQTKCEPISPKYICYISSGYTFQGTKIW